MMQQQPLMPSSPQPMMQQQPMQMQPMQMQPMQQQPMMMVVQQMPMVKLQMSAQQNNSPQYPASFQNTTVPLHQMGYPTYPPVSSSAPDRTPPVPGEQMGFDSERAKWIQAWEAEE